MLTLMRITASRNATSRMEMSRVTGMDIASSLESGYDTVACRSAMDPSHSIGHEKLPAPRWLGPVLCPSCRRLGARFAGVAQDVREMRGDRHRIGRGDQTKKSPPPGLPCSMA